MLERLQLSMRAGSRASKYFCSSCTGLICRMFAAAFKAHLYPCCRGPHATPVSVAKLCLLCRINRSVSLAFFICLLLETAAGLSWWPCCFSVTSTYFLRLPFFFSFFFFFSFLCIKIFLKKPCLFTSLVLHSHLAWSHVSLAFFKPVCSSVATLFCLVNACDWLDLSSGINLSC